ncbi:hypothetical protein GOODEAATRI_003078, partial [Goodea atripinnis]
GGPGNAAQKELTCLFSSIASFYHPSNHGRWQICVFSFFKTRLMRLLQRLPASVVRRVHRERYAGPSWITVVPDCQRLTDADLQEFTRSLTGAALLAMFSCMIGMARSLVSPDNRYPEGRVHVLPLLMGSLPGVDPNDFSKCMITFQFITTFTTLVPLVDCSSAPTQQTDLTEVALQKLYNFATSSIFETCVSGRMVADMCKAAAKNDDELDKELLWNLQLLSEVIRVDGEQLLKYQGELERILHVCVSLRCKQAYTLACSLLEHTLRSLSLIYPTEYRSTSGGFNTNLPIQACGLEVDWLCWFACQLFQWKKRQQRSAALWVPFLQDWGRAGDVISDLMFFCGTHKKEFDSRWKSFTLVKKSMENRGTLYCLLGASSGFCPASTRDWDCVGEVWPALVRCGLSHSVTLEKPSIGRLFDDIIDRIHRLHDTIGIYFTVSHTLNSNHQTGCTSGLLIVALWSLPSLGVREMC